MKISAALEAMASANAAARPHARIADVVTTDVQEPLRGRIRDALAECGSSEAEVLRLSTRTSTCVEGRAVINPGPAD